LSLLLLSHGSDHTAAAAASCNGPDERLARERPYARAKLRRPLEWDPG